MAVVFLIRVICCDNAENVRKSRQLERLTRRNGMRILPSFFRGDNKKLPFIAGLLVAAVSMTASLGLSLGQVSASGVDCDNNAIIKCGFSTPSEFINRVKAKSSGNGHNDLPTVYAGMGLSASDYNNFVSRAQPGEVRRNGDIVVNGQVVETGAMSFGRLASYHGSDYFKKIIGSTTYYGNTVDKTFASGVQSLPVYVLFNSKGEAQFAVMKACGNPTWGKVVQTSASCSALTQKAVAGKQNTYQFTATAAHSGNATIKSYVYNFGDGSKTVTTTDGSTPVTHTYAKAGTFKATVTVYASVPGNANMQLPAVSLCSKTITVTMPFYNCVQLVGAILDKSKMQYRFTVTANYGNGASFTGADFDFGDGKTQTGVKPGADTKTVTVDHMYVTAGSYNAAATLHFSVSGSAVTAPTCKALVTPETVTPECKPGVPVGSPECTPCQYDSSLPSNSDQCVPPTPPELPNTGAGNTIALFAAVMVAGFLVYRQLLFKKHRAAFAAAEQGTSPLPLGDPLSDNPLAGTPLATARKRVSLRRRRPF
jgi:hypothetical protein